MKTNVKVFFLTITILFALPTFSQTTIDYQTLRSMDSENTFLFLKDWDTSPPGLKVYSIGDINGDGINDLIFAENVARSYTCTFYVVYGGIESFPNGMLTPYDSTFSSFRGFRLILMSQYRGHYWHVGSIGDFNKDGMDDIIITVVPGTNKEIPINGIMIYGKERNFTTLVVKSDSRFPKTEGLYMSQMNYYDYITEYSVIRTGDINNDGIDDGLIRIQGYGGGMIYTLYGNESIINSINLENQPSSSKFRLYDKDPTEMLAIESIGDINHDGLVDFAARSSDKGGDLYVLYGRMGGFSDINATDIPNNQGFRIKGGRLDNTADYRNGPAGDINGDDIDDFTVGIEGNIYFIYGKASGFSEIDLDNLTTLDGFKITESAINEEKPQNMYAIPVGDINNDGFDDVIIYILNHSRQYSKNYFIFGQKDRRPDIDVAGETLLIFEQNMTYNSLEPIKVGDLNGDGADDLVFNSWDTIYGLYGSKCEEFADCSSPMPSICFASKKCTCRNKNMLIQEMSCVSSCSPGYFQAPNSTCKICPINCKVCSSTRKCVECFEGFLNQESACVISCPDGYLQIGSICQSIARIIWPVIGGLFGLAIITIPTVYISRRLGKQNRKSIPSTERLEFEIELKKALTPGDERGDSYLEHPIEYVDTANNDRHSIYVLREEGKGDNEEAEGINMNDQQQAEYEAQVKRVE